MGLRPPIPGPRPMYMTVIPISALLSGVGLLLLGSGLLGTLLAVRAGMQGYADLVIGLVMSAYFAGFLVGTWLAPRLIVRVGHIRYFAVCASVAACTALLHVLWVDPWFWALLRLLTGMALVGLYTVVESWLNSQSSTDRRGQVFALYMMVNLGALAIGQWLILLADPGGFALFAAISILFSLSLIPVAMTRLEQPVQVAHAPVSLRRLYSAAPVGVVGALLSGLIMGAFWGMGPLFAQRLDLGITGVAMLMSVVILGGAALQFPIGRYSDRHDRRRVLAKAAALAAVAAISALLLMRWHGALLYPLMFIYGGLAFALYPICVAHLIDQLDGGEVLGGSSGLLLLHGSGAAIGPALAGLLMSLLGTQALLLYFAIGLLPLAAFALRHAVPAADDEVVVDDQTGTFVPMVRTSPAALEMLPDHEDPRMTSPTGQP